VVPQAEASGGDGRAVPREKVGVVKATSWAQAATTQGARSEDRAYATTEEMLAALSPSRSALLMAFRTDLAMRRYPGLRAGTT
jgi:hypothetical protein